MSATSGLARATEPEAPSDASLAAIIASLRPLQALDGGLRALPLCPDRVQSTPTADRGSSDGASDAGVLGRARILHRRLRQIPAPARVTLEWLVTYAHAGTSPWVLAGMLARSCGPLALRDAVDLAEHHRRAAQSTEAQLARECQLARVRLRHGVTLPDDATARARHDAARGAVTAADARLDAAEAALAGWGYARIVVACLAWVA